MTPSVSDTIGGVLAVVFFFAVQALVSDAPAGTFIKETIMIQDAINAGFEFGAGIAVLHHCFKLHMDKQVRGLSIPAVFFFTAWGFWNIYYYPFLGQPWSFAGGIFVTLANCIYVAMLVHYSPGLVDRARRAVRRFFGRLVCLVRGHDWPGYTFRINTLYFCSRCSAEMFGRTLDDLYDMPALSNEDLEEIQRDIAHYHEGARP